jgi:hypothetical protein
MIAGDVVTDRLPAGSVLTVVANAAGVGYVARYGATGLPDRSFDTIGSAGVALGPFAEDERFVIRVTAGVVTYSMARFDPALNERVGGNDVLKLYGDGAPVDYTDGTPPATGEGTAGPGSEYTDYTGANLYINGGTKAQPIWKLVTRAA